MVSAHLGAIMQKRYLGDWFATFFGWFGLQAKPGCGCEKRKQKLNAMHQKAEAMLVRRKK